MTKLFNRKPVQDEDLATDVTGNPDQPWHPNEAEHQKEDKLLPGDLLTEIYKRGRTEYDDRHGDMRSQRDTAIKGFFSALGVAALAIGGCIYLGSLSKVEVVTLERDKNLDVVAVRTVGGKAYGDKAYISADIKRWITNARTVYTDANALKNNIKSVYTMIASGSPAFEVVGEFYRKDDPFEKAKKFTTEVVPDFAIPNGDGLPDSEGRITWRTEWQEKISDRNGILIRTEKWTASITFLLVDPDSAQQVFSNPSGIYITNIAWSRKDITG